MRAFNDPVHLVVDVGEETRAIALFKALENRANVSFGDHRFLLSMREQLLARLGRDVLPQDVEPTTSLVQYMVQALLICFGDNRGAASHPIFPGGRRGAALHP